jgi:hypothetical protein
MNSGHTKREEEMDGISQMIQQGVGWQLVALTGTLAVLFAGAFLTTKREDKGSARAFFCSLFALILTSLFLVLLLATLGSHAT